MKHIKQMIKEIVDSKSEYILFGFYFFGAPVKKEVAVAKLNEINDENLQYGMWAECDKNGIIKNIKGGFNMDDKLKDTISNVCDYVLEQEYDYFSDFILEGNKPEDHIYYDAFKIKKELGLLDTTIDEIIAEIKGDE